MPYNRNAALGEAQATWDRPCRDGKISRISGAPLDVATERRKLGLGGDWEARFITGFDGEFEAACFVRGAETKKFHGWDGLGDCAHFMSKCLQAGGVNISTDYVPTLQSSLYNQKNTKTLAIKASEERATRIIRSKIANGQLIKPGDVILYYDPTGTKIQGLGPIYHHSALFVGHALFVNPGQDPNTAPLDGAIACHTRSRFMQSWLLVGRGDTDTYTLVHFGDDDPVNPALAAALAGWWEVKWQGKNYYYFYDKNGKVSWKTPKPANKQQSMFGAEGTGYWFWKGPNSYLICWTQSGSVEEYTLTSSATQTGKWNDTTPLTGKKL